jgi:hypothetical protein
MNKELSQKSGWMLIGIWKKGGSQALLQADR